jgi:hypothetical protein
MAESGQSSKPAIWKNLDTSKGRLGSRQINHSGNSYSGRSCSKCCQSDFESNVHWMPKLMSAAMSCISNEDSALVRSRTQDSKLSLTGRESLQQPKHIPHRSSFLHRMAARISYTERFSGNAPLIASAINAAKLSYSGDGVTYEVQKERPSLQVAQLEVEST